MIPKNYNLPNGVLESDIVGNAKMIPDASMDNATDIYTVPLDDIKAAIELINKIKVA